MKVFGEISFEEINCAYKDYFGLLKIAFGLVNRGYSFLEGHPRVECQNFVE